MTQRSSGFLVGTFVIVGVLLGVFALGYFGEGQRYLRTYSTYVTFFAESVDGLGVNSPVMYQGLEIGHIQSLEVAEDPRYIQVTLQVTRPELVTRDVYTQITSTGFTGSNFVNIVPNLAGQSGPGLKPDLKVAYPVIPSRPSQLSGLMASAQSIANQLQQADLQRTVEEIDRTVRVAGDLLQSARLQDILARLDRASQSLDETLANLNQATRTGELEQILTETRGLLSDLQSQAQAANIPEVASSAQAALEDFNRQAALVGTEATDTLEELRRTADGLNRLVERLYLRPSDLLYSQPPASRRGTR
jgi:phospholipid/cholesterol/gamma-HCH transport system substrate-binding protein